DGVASIQATGGRIGVTTNLQRLADGCIRAGRLSEARDALDGAFANMREYGDYGIETKLQRAKGDRILAESGDNAAAESCYRVGGKGGEKEGRVKRARGAPPPRPAMAHSRKDTGSAHTPVGHLRAVHRGLRFAGPRQRPRRPGHYAIGGGGTRVPELCGSPRVP